MTAAQIIAKAPETTLKVPETEAEIEASEDGTLDIRLPMTREGWDLLESLDDGDTIIIISSDGDRFISRVQDTDAGRCTITVELI